MESSVVLLLLFAPSTYSSLLMMLSDGALTFFVFVVLCVAVQMFWRGKVLEKRFLIESNAVIDYSFPQFYQ
jgi:hypothetical protein